MGGHAAAAQGAGMNTKTDFPFRIDIWDEQGNSIERHVACVDDFEAAVATYWAACRRWPKAKITLRQGARIVHKELGRLLSPPEYASQDLLRSRPDRRLSHRTELTYLRRPRRGMARQGLTDLG